MYYIFLSYTIHIYHYTVLLYWALVGLHILHLSILGNCVNEIHNTGSTNLSLSHIFKKFMQEPGAPIFPFPYLAIMQMWWCLAVLLSLSHWAQVLVPTSIFGNYANETNAVSL